jgi:hypothetical protein
MLELRFQFSPKHLLVSVFVSEFSFLNSQRSAFIFIFIFFVLFGNYMCNLVVDLSCFLLLPFLNFFLFLFFNFKMFLVDYYVMNINANLI